MIARLILMFVLILGSSTTEARSSSRPVKACEQRSLQVCLAYCTGDASCRQECNAQFREHCQQELAAVPRTFGPSSDDATEAQNPPTATASRRTRQEQALHDPSAKFYRPGTPLGDLVERQRLSPQLPTSMPMLARCIKSSGQPEDVCRCAVAPYAVPSWEASGLGQTKLFLFTGQQPRTGRLSGREGAEMLMRTEAKQIYDCLTSGADDKTILPKWQRMCVAEGNRPENCTCAFNEAKRTFSALDMDVIRAAIQGRGAPLSELFGPDSLRYSRILLQFRKVEGSCNVKSLANAMSGLR